MAENITLASLANLQNDSTATAAINNNNSIITTAFVDCLSRSGTQPNTMGASLDMNNNHILNLPAPGTPTSPARLIDVVNNPTLLLTVPPTGTSGAVVPFLNGNNTWSGNQLFNGGMQSNSTFAAGTFGVGFANVSVGNATTNASFILLNTSGTAQFSVGNDSFASGKITLSSGANAMQFIGNDYVFSNTVATPQHSSGFTSLTIDNTVNGGAIFFTRAGIGVGDIFNTAVSFVINSNAANGGQFQQSSLAIAGWNSSGIYIGNTGTLGGLLALQGLTSGQATISVTASTSTLQLNGSNCTVDTSGNVLVASLNLTQAFNTSTPTTYTGTSGTITSMSSILNPSGTFTATLPTASSNAGRWLYIKSIAAQLINSASSNVVPLAGGAAGTALIGSATAGKFVILQSDGTNWQIMAAN